jgi:hypothetical protein
MSLGIEVGNSLINQLLSEHGRRKFVDFICWFMLRWVTQSEENINSKSGTWENIGFLASKI